MITRFTFRGDCSDFYHRRFIGVARLWPHIYIYVCTLFREYAIQKDIVTDASQRESENTVIGNRFSFKKNVKKNIIASGWLAWRWATWWTTGDSFEIYEPEFWALMDGIRIQEYIYILLYATTI